MIHWGRNKEGRIIQNSWLIYVHIITGLTYVRLSLHIRFSRTHLTVSLDNPFIIQITDLRLYLGFLDYRAFQLLIYENV